MDVSGIALVTGAGSGIGRCTAIALAEEGVLGLSLVDINEQALKVVQRECEAVAKEKSMKTITLVRNMSSEEDIIDMVRTTVGEFGRLDYAVNCAGIAFKSVVAETNSSDYDRISNLNLKGLFVCLREEIKQMSTQEPQKNCAYGVQRGAIVNMSSICGITGVKTSSAYVASKHGVIGLTKTAALEYPEIRTNAVCPGYILTPIFLNGSDKLKEAAKEKTENWIPMKRMGEPEEVANLVVFLLSNRSSYATGGDFTVDGGYSAL
ncbi:hypothetical protein V1511DRAFT_507838 [Dipodascopsis uninucleata]